MEEEAGLAENVLALRPMGGAQVDAHQGRGATEGLIKPAERSHERALAAAAGTDDGEDLPGRQGEVEPIHDDVRAVADRQVDAGEDVGAAHRSNRLKITAKSASEITMKVMPSTAADVAASPTPKAERLATDPR